MEQAIGEDMPSLAIGCQLRLVQRDKGVATARPVHRFGRAEEVARLRRLDPFLAGDQGDLLLALDGDHAVVDFARQKTERETDHPARVAAHPLDSEMRLAGVGGSEDRLDRGVAHADLSGIAGPVLQPALKAFQLIA